MISIGGAIKPVHRGEINSRRFVVGLNPPPPEHESDETHPAACKSILALAGGRKAALQSFCGPAADVQPCGLDIARLSRSASHLKESTYEPCGFSFALHYHTITTIMTNIGEGCGHAKSCLTICGVTFYESGRPDSNRRRPAWENAAWLGSIGS